MLAAALPHDPQEIFIGDLRQLPPVFGPAILGFKMSLLPVIELTEVYRQALLSPIIRLAHVVVSGDARSFHQLVSLIQKVQSENCFLLWRLLMRKARMEQLRCKSGRRSYQSW